VRFSKLRAATSPLSWIGCSVEYSDDRNRILIGNEKDQKGKSSYAGEPNWFDVEREGVRSSSDVVQLIVDLLAEVIGQRR